MDSAQGSLVGAEGGAERFAPPVPGPPLCPCCGSVRTSPFDELRVCGRCRHVWQADLTPTVSYDAAYQLGITHARHAEMSALRLRLLDGLPQGALVCDFGCGPGHFVEAARAAGYQAFGIDCGPIRADLRPAPRQNQAPWEALTLFDSLEHLPRLAEVVELAAGHQVRLVAVSTPAAPCWFPLGRRWRHYKPGEHLHYFNPDSLGRLFRDYQACLLMGLEDVIRTPWAEHEPNVLTMVFRRRNA